MSVIGKFKAGVKKYMAEADQRADRRLAKAKTQAGRESERARIQKERLHAKREIAQAKTALLQAEAKRKKAAKEVRDLGGGRSFSGLSNFLWPKKAKKRTTRRKTRKTATRRR